MECKSFNAECGKCFHVNCRYHLLDDLIAEGLSDCAIVRKIMRAKHTCLFEITEKSPDGVTLEEIGDILDMKVGNVRVINHRATKKLQDAFNAKNFALNAQVPEHG